MRINEIVTEHVDDSKAFVNGNMIDPELQEIRKRKEQEEEGIDPNLAEIVQDFPV